MIYFSVRVIRVRYYGDCVNAYTPYFIRRTFHYDWLNGIVTFGPDLVIFQWIAMKFFAVSRKYLAYTRLHDTDFAIFALNERNVNLVAICAVILVMQRLSSEATTCPNTTCARSIPEHDQRAVISFFVCSCNHKVINRYVLYVKHTLIA